MSQNEDSISYLSNSKAHNNHFWNDYYVLSPLQRVHSHTHAHIHTHTHAHTLRLFLFNILLFLSSFSRCGNRHPKWFTCSRINKSTWQSQDSNLSPSDHQSCALPYLWSPCEPCWCLITKSTGGRISERGWGNAGRSLSWPQGLEVRWVGQWMNCWLLNFDCDNMVVDSFQESINSLSQNLYWKSESEVNNSNACSWRSVQ